MRNVSRPALALLMLATQVNNPLLGADTALAASSDNVKDVYEVRLQVNADKADDIIVVSSLVKKPDYEAEVLAPLHAAQAAADAEAKAEVAAKAASEAAAMVGITYQVATAVLPAGSHIDWMAAAGIAESDYGYVDYIIDAESGWGVTKWNYGGSGAYGLGQALPASKMAVFGDDYMTNPVTQLKWANSYAVGRYGSWAGAYAFWTTSHWW